MTPEEREVFNARVAEMKAWLKDYNRAQRDKRLRAGRAKPRTHREMAIFAKDLVPPPEAKNQANQDKQNQPKEFPR